jgi:hypothetical protein
VQKKAKRILTADEDNRSEACKGRARADRLLSWRETARGTVHEHVLAARLVFYTPGSIGFTGSRDGWGGTQPMSLLSGIGVGMPYFTPYSRRAIQRPRRRYPRAVSTVRDLCLCAGRRSKVFACTLLYLSGRSPSERSRAVLHLLTLWVRDAAIRNR